MKYIFTFTFKYKFSLALMREFTTLEKRGNSQKNVFHNNFCLFLGEALTLCFWLCLNILIFVEWNWFFFSRRLYNKLGILRGLNSPTRTQNSFTKLLFPPFSSRSFWLLHNAEMFSPNLWLLPIVIVLLYVYIFLYTKWINLFKQSIILHFTATLASIIFLAKYKNRPHK